jgi:hypothetical protein
MRRHRREVSKLLREQFPNTQFALTTHDEIWLRHMKSVGLVESNGYVHFRTWTVDVGPKEWDDDDVWAEIDGHLAKSDVRAAAALLRNYLEHFGRGACRELRASVEYRGDAQYTLGELLPNAMARFRKLLKSAKHAAASWNQISNESSITAKETAFAAAAAATKADEWQINAIVHYNEWADLKVQDFQPVVAAFRALLQEFHCNQCSALLFATPSGGSVQALRCGCGIHNYNLIVK